MSRRPLLFVDIDGVLNPIGPRCPPGFVEHDLPPIQDPVRVCALHSCWLHELSQPFQLVWGSWWPETGREALATVLDLPRFRGAVRRPGDYLTAPVWKVPVVAELAGARALAWLDDQFTPGAWRWAEQRLEPTLLIPVTPDLGLSRDHVDRLLRWASLMSDGGDRPVDGSSDRSR